MARMFNPPPPGEVLREYLGDIRVFDIAARVGVTDTTLSRILNGSTNITANITSALEAVFGTSADMWLGMQSDYDTWQSNRNSPLSVSSSQQYSIDQAPNHIHTAR